MFVSRLSWRAIVARLAVIPISLTVMAMAGACSQQASEFEGTGAAGTSASITYPTLHKTITIDGLDIFYREAGCARKEKSDATPRFWPTGFYPPII